jgi:hypothetical protein
VHLAFRPQTGEALSNRTFWGLPGQALCGTMQTHRVCKRPVPKPRGFPSRAGLRLDSIASVESREKARSGSPYGASVLKPNRAHGGETPVSPVVYSARLIYVSSLSGAFGKGTAMFVSYSARQHRCPPPDIPLRLASYVKNARPDVIHLLMRDKPPSLLVQGQQPATVSPALLRHDGSMVKLGLSLYQEYMHLSIFVAP